MTEREALIQLRDAVRAGREPEWDDVDDAMHNQWSRCLMAFNGSLDAAKALHEAVLPEWFYEIKTWTSHLPQKSCVAVGNNYKGTAKNPARAWLLAILEALIAEAKIDE